MFVSLISFGLWGEKTWSFSKSVRHDSQNRSLLVQMAIFRNFVMEAKLFEWKFSVIGRKHRISSENVFSGLSKAHFKCPVQHFEIKMIKVNFTFCAPFTTLCVFFCSERKVSQGCQNHKLSVQRKYLGRVFLTPMLFQKVFWFRAEELAVLAENYPHRCQIYYLWVRRNISRATFLKQVFKHFNFFGVLVKIPWQQSTNIFIVDKIAKSVWRNKLTKNLFQEKKKLFYIFQVFERNFFAISEKIPAWLSKL